MNWPHAPKHWLFEPGVYMVTAGTYRKAHHLHTGPRRDFFQSSLFAVTEEYGWPLHAWAILSNHYHFIARSPDDPSCLKRMIAKLHTTTAKQLNLVDAQPGRKVWHQYRDTKLTFLNSYLARLRYVHHNPVHHGVVSNAECYEWCSAAWFAQNAPRSFVQTVNTFKTDRLNVPDDD